MVKRWYKKQAPRGSRWRCRLGWHDDYATGSPEALFCPRCLRVKLSTPVNRVRFPAPAPVRSRFGMRSLRYERERGGSSPSGSTKDVLASSSG